MTEKKKRVREVEGDDEQRVAKHGREDKKSQEEALRRGVRAAAARYSRVCSSALALAQRATVLLRRTEAECASVAEFLLAGKAAPDFEFVERSKNKFGPQLSAAQQTAVPWGKMLEKSEPVPLRFDELGRPVDAEGKVLNVERSVSLLANKKMDKEYRDSLKPKKEMNPYAKTYFDKKDFIDEDLVDPRLQPRRREHRKGAALNFIKEGHYVRIAEAARARVAGVDVDYVREDENNVVLLERQQKEEPKTAEEAAMMALPRRSAQFALVPGMEWWDEAFLDEKTKEKRDSSVAKRLLDDYSSCKPELCQFLKLVQHPVPVKPLATAISEPKTMPFYLTKKDRRRVRRQARAEWEREKRDKIQLGLLPPPEPKFKLSNFMKVLGQQAVSDPSKLEKKVMAQVRQRLQSHDMRNAARKLTPQERKEKKRKKLLEDTSHEVQVAVFYVSNLDDPQARFKIDVNAKQLNVSGAVVLCDSPEANFALVVAEGGPKAINKMSNLLTRRIDWGKAKTTNNSESKRVWCAQVWRGAVVKRNFSAFKFQECQTAFTARRLLQAKGVPHYWDQALQRHDKGPPDANTIEQDTLAAAANAAANFQEGGADFD